MDVVELQPEGRTSKRTGQTRDFTPGAGRVNNFAPAGQGAYGLKNHPTVDVLQHTIPTPGQAQTFTGEIATGDNDRFGTKSRVENPWGTAASLNIASEQLSDNKINHDIAKPEALQYDAANPAAQQRFRPVPWMSGSVTPLWKQQKLQKKIK
jgi:hypothetical protein